MNDKGIRELAVNGNFYIFIGLGLITQLVKTQGMLRFEHFIVCNFTLKGSLINIEAVVNEKLGLYTGRYTVYCTLKNKMKG